jgi:hypothetical protein
MRTHGRANWIVIVGLLGLLAIGALFILGGESPTSVGARFMAALGEGRASELATMSYMPGLSPEEKRARWERTVRFGKHYRFRWEIVSERMSDADTASVRMRVWRNAMDPMSYEEPLELPMVKRDGKWLVDVRGLNRDLYPALPR